MKTPKDIKDPSFDEDSIGWASINDYNHLLTMDKGTVYIPNDGNLKWIAVLRRTRLDLQPVANPVGEWVEYRIQYELSLPNVNQKRLEFIKQTRGQHYTDLGIHPLACIGSEGMGYEWDNGKWLEFPQRGGVSIGKDVRIGEFTSVKRGTINDTVIGDGCKIGSHCNIGHNVEIGKNCLITHRVSVGGSTEIGDNVVIWQGAIIRNKLKIGDGAVIAQGANVICDVPANKIAKGNPAKIYDKP